MKNPKINYEEYELTNGECVAMSTAPILMLTLRKSDKKSYETLSKVLVKGVNDKDALEVAEFLYAAYKRLHVVYRVFRKYGPGLEKEHGSD